MVDQTIFSPFVIVHCLRMRRSIIPTAAASRNLGYAILMKVRVGLNS